MDFKKDSGGIFFYVQVLLDGNQDFTYVPGEPNPRQAYQVYDSDSGSAAVAASSLSLPQTTARVLLPTTNTILAYGYSSGIPVNGKPAGAEVFSPRCSNLRACWQASSCHSCSGTTHPRCQMEGPGT